MAADAGSAALAGEARGCSDDGDAARGAGTELVGGAIVGNGEALGADAVAAAAAAAATAA